LTAIIPGGGRSGLSTFHHLSRFMSKKAKAPTLEATSQLPESSVAKVGLPKVPGLGTKVEVDLDFGDIARAQTRIRKTIVSTRCVRSYFLSQVTNFVFVSVMCCLLSFRRRELLHPYKKPSVHGSRSSQEQTFTSSLTCSKSQVFPLPQQPEFAIIEAGVFHHTPFRIFQGARCLERAVAFEGGAEGKWCHCSLCWKPRLGFVLARYQLLFGGAS